MKNIHNWETKKITRRKLLKIGYYCHSSNLTLGSPSVIDLEFQGFLVATALIWWVKKSK